MHTMSDTSPTPLRVRSPIGALRVSLFGISPSEASFARRGFPPCDAAARERFESIGRTFIRGYRAALADDRPGPLAAELDRVESDLRGFAFEGAAMGLAIFDCLTPWRSDRLARFLAGPGEPHAYMLHVGAGWALARLGRRIDRSGPQVPRLANGSRSGGDAAPGEPDPLLRWLVADGYGFHEGYFHWRRTLLELRVPETLEGYARRAFDQGLGRALWFVEGADVARATAAVAAFPRERRADLWSGIGLAATYAGAIDRAGLEALRAAGDQPELAQGAAFAAKARLRANNPTPHTDLACRVLCGVGAAEAALVTDRALENPPETGVEPGYEIWRRRVRTLLPKPFGDGSARADL